MATNARPSHDSNARLFITRPMSCLRRTHNHYSMLSSSCDFITHIDVISSWYHNEMETNARPLSLTRDGFDDSTTVSSTDASACYHHLVISTDTYEWMPHHAVSTKSRTFLPSIKTRMKKRCSPNEDFGRRNKCIPPKRRSWKDEQKMKSGLSKHFSRVWVLDLGY